MIPVFSSCSKIDEYEIFYLFIYFHYICYFYFFLWGGGENGFDFDFECFNGLFICFL